MTGTDIEDSPIFLFHIGWISYLSIQYFVFQVKNKSLDGREKGESIA